MNDSTVVLDGVSKSFRSGSDRLQVLKNVNLRVESGESVAVVGSSGCGKSTLLNLIGGLDTTDEGTLEACGYPVSVLSERGLTEFRSRGVGFVFQFHYLLKDFTALENVMLPMVMAGRRRSDAMNAARDGLERVRILDRSDHYPSQLSGGERQRAALARALVNDPGLILADEPTGNLDEAHKTMVADLLFSLTADAGKTLILVTHAVDLAERADRVLQLSEGTLVPA